MSNFTRCPKCGHHHTMLTLDGLWRVIRGCLRCGHIWSEEQVAVNASDGGFVRREARP